MTPGHSSILDLDLLARAQPIGPKRRTLSPSGCMNPLWGPGAVERIFHTVAKRDFTRTSVVVVEGQGAYVVSPCASSLRKAILKSRGRGSRQLGTRKPRQQNPGHMPIRDKIMSCIPSKSLPKYLSKRLQFVNAQNPISLDFNPNTSY